MPAAVNPATRALGLPGYAVTAEIYRGGKTVVYRAVRERDQLPVILKTLLDDFPTARQNAGMRREYELLSDLDISGVPQACALETYRDRLALVMADAGGVTLKSLIAEGAIDLRRFLDFAPGHRRPCRASPVTSPSVAVPSLSAWNGGTPSPT